MNKFFRENKWAKYVLYISLFLVAYQAYEYYQNYQNKKEIKINISKKEYRNIILEKIIN